MKLVKLTQESYCIIFVVEKIYRHSETDKIWSDKREDVILYTYWFFCQIFMDHAWLGTKKCHFRVQVLPCLRVVFFYYPSQSFMDGEKVLFVDMVCSSCLIFAFCKKCQNMKKKCCIKLKMPYLDSPHSKNPYVFTISFNNLRTKFWHLQNITLT